MAVMMIYIALHIFRYKPRYVGSVIDIIYF